VKADEIFRTPCAGYEKDDRVEFGLVVLFLHSQNLVLRDPAAFIFQLYFAIFISFQRHSDFE
jgi:hypothetical protein